MTGAPPRRAAVVLGIGLGVGVAALVAGCLPATEESSLETHTRPGARTLVVRLDAGSLHLREHSGAEFDIEIRRSASAPTREAARAALEALVVDFGRLESPAAESEGGNDALLITSRRATAGAFRPWEDLGLRLRIAVPAGAGVDVRTAAGRIELEGLTGSVRATSASGRIVARNLRSPTGPDPRPVRLRTGDGRIEGEGLEGSYRAETADGRITLRGRLREVTALSADGRIEVEVLAGDPAPAGDWLLRTANGRVRLTLPRDADALITAVGRTTGEDRRDLSDWRREGPLSLATLGDGSGPRIHLRTDDGSVRVRRPGEN